MIVSGVLPDEKFAKHLGGVFYNSFLTIGNKKRHRNALYYKLRLHLTNKSLPTPFISLSFAVSSTDPNEFGPSTNLSSRAIHQLLAGR